MTTEIIVLIIIIPILSVLLGIISYNLYINFNKQNRIIKQLSVDPNEILAEKKKQSIFNKKERNWLGKKLTYAGFDSPYSEIVFIIISTLFGFLSATFINFAITNPLVFIIGWIIFSFFPLLVLKKIIDNRQEEFNFGLKIIIDKVTSMMKSGVGFEQALKKSVLTSKSKFTEEVFNIYLIEKDIIGEEKSFEKMFKLVESKELRIFYLTISIGRQSGGKFSNTLEKLRKTLHDQGEIKQEITASTREVKVGSYMIIALVIFIYEMMDSSMEGVLDEHFFGTNEGQIQMFFIAVWVGFGLFVNNLLTKVK
ncbi:type II secretion system F family protein [Arcobacter sp. LA11]|uniref:type II secretion system F family protein n=1 Tax=Arcobacter sp. LA11 TaxID=1898176 RepID=UPI00093513CA|nr:type II secretion system F family protein [Arcobacter sp. LA11]